MKALVLGASKGLGLEITKKLCANGSEVYGASRTPIKEAPQTYHFMACDLSDLDSVQSFVQDIQNQDWDEFYWVSGQMLKGDFGSQSSDEILKNIDVNFRNAALIAQAVWKKMIHADSPKKFALVSSSSGLKAKAEEVVYAATKHAQVGFARSLGLENTNPNLKVSLFMPGGMKTPFWDGNKPDVYNEFLDPEEVAQKILDSIQNQSETYLEVSIPRGSL